MSDDRKAAEQKVNLKGFVIIWTAVLCVPTFKPA